MHGAAVALPELLHQLEIREGCARAQLARARLPGRARLAPEAAAEALGRGGDLGEDLVGIRRQHVRRHLGRRRGTR